mmetsp:Transcript_39918/g.120188  ORF Transcript_39918/g.120188 Transcript_39918/m.120188 type:complete len:155 (-) Transcript_39918:1084-1548(-)
MSNPLQTTSILTVILWTKVFVTNIGLGGAKQNAGGRAPEDTYQKPKDEVSGEDAANLDRSQRIVNNDLENIPITMIMAAGSAVVIHLVGSTNGYDLSLAHTVLYSIFVAARFGHSIAYARGLSIGRSLVWLVGVLASFGIGINGAIASYRLPAW